MQKYIKISVLLCVLISSLISSLIFTESVFAKAQTELIPLNGQYFQLNRQRTYTINPDLDNILNHIVSENQDLLKVNKIESKGYDRMLLDLNQSSDMVDKRIYQERKQLEKEKQISLQMNQFEIERLIEQQRNRLEKQLEAEKYGIRSKNEMRMSIPELQIYPNFKVNQTANRPYYLLTK